MTPHRFRSTDGFRTYIPTEELGRTAVRLALNRQERQHVVLGTHIVVRGSVRPPAHPHKRR